MITKTFYLGGNNNHVDGSHPTRQRGCKFWYIVIWKDLETVHPAFDPQANNVSIFKHVSPDCKKRAHVKKCARFAQYPASVTRPVKPPGEQYLQNSSFTMSISKSCKVKPHAKFDKWSNRNLSGIHNSLFVSVRGAPAEARDSQPSLRHVGFGGQPSLAIASEGWWRQTGSNRRPEACKATALPTELCPQLAIIPDEAG